MCSHKDVTERRGAILLHVSVLINFVLYREKQAWDKSTFWLLSELFSSKEEVYKVESDIFFWWFWFNFWSQIIQQYLWLWPKTDRNILPQCADLIDSMIWSTIEVKFSQAGVERSNESVSDAKNSCSTPAWSKNLSTYCPLSHLMPRSFPWARNPITLVNSRKGRG